jgi:hypothetical protein
MLALVLAAGHASAIDLGLEDDAEYASMISAMRAAEYVRTDMILSSDERPRLYAGLAGLMAFSERNPDATDGQLAAFLGAWDAALAAFDDRDPDLDRPATLHAAVRFARVDDPALVGMDTDIGRRALSLMGASVPDPDGFESIQLRMVRYETALARGLEHRPAIYEMLVAGFFGQDMAGNERDALPGMLNAYFLANGVDPALGMVRGDLPEIDAGLASMPADFAAYQAAIAVGAANEQLQTDVEAEFTLLRDRMDAIVDGLTNSDTTPSLVDGLDVTPQEMQAIIDALQDRLMETAESRAFTAGAAFLMLQSQFDEIEAYGSNAQDFSAITLQTSDTFAYIEGSLNIASNLTQAYFNYGDGDYASMTDNLFGAASDVLGLVGLNFGGPSVDEQIFDQVVELRQQVEDLRIEMNERFDRIDQQLGIMYETIVLGFDEIGDQIGDLQDDVDSIVLEIASARSQLRRLEAALYGVAEDILLTDLTNEANIVLDYRDENGVDLPYAGGSPDFITASESFFTYATVTALSEAFAGSRSNPTVTLANADEYVGNGPVARYLNDLAVLPGSLGLPALTNTDLVGVEPWSQAAAAYAQLSRESPWYFNYRYTRQLADYNADPVNESLPELDRTIRSGERLESFVEAIREVDGDGQSALFGALADNYRAAADAVQAEIDAIIAANTPVLVTNGSTTLDFWNDGSQNISALLTNLGEITVSGLSYTLPIPSSAANMGYNTFCRNDSVAESRRTQMWHLLRRQEEINSGGSAENVRARASFSVSGIEGIAQIWIGGGGVDTTAYRTIRFNIYEYLASANLWVPLFFPSTAEARDAFGQVWREEQFGGSWSFDNDVASDRRSPGVGSQYSESPVQNPFSPRYRIVVSGLSSSPVPVSAVQPRLYAYRSAIHGEILAELTDPASGLFAAVSGLDHAESLIDAYVTLGMPLELQESEVLRAALRGTPDLVNPRELGLRSGDVFGMVADMFGGDASNAWGDGDWNVNLIGDVLHDRIDIVEAEIERGLDRPSATPGYVGWVLAELNHLRDTAFNQATDDTYFADTGGVVTVGASEGLIANDPAQAYRVVTIDSDFFTDPAHLPPAHGVITVDTDGGFSYQADPGFVGEDRFTYRTRTEINSSGAVAFSNPATVVIRVDDPSCSAADLSQPYGTLDFFDVAVFLNLFNAQDPLADFAEPTGTLNFFDISAFISVYLAGCDG